MAQTGLIENTVYVMVTSALCSLLTNDDFKQNPVDPSIQNV